MRGRSSGRFQSPTTSQGVCKFGFCEPRGSFQQTCARDAVSPDCDPRGFPFGIEMCDARDCQRSEIRGGCEVYPSVEDVLLVAQDALVSACEGRIGAPGQVGVEVQTIPGA